MKAILEDDAVALETKKRIIAEVEREKNEGKKMDQEEYWIRFV